jgi:GGDEF domain-containing protein
MMTRTTERDYLAELGSAVASYLNVLTAVAACLASVCPEIGTPYRKRIEQLRTRLSFETTPEAIKASARTVEEELKDFAMVAGRYLDEHDLVLRRAVLSLGDIIEAMAHRHDFHGVGFREMTVRMETIGAEDSVPLAQTVVELRRYIDNMSHETASMLGRLREEMLGVEERLRGSQSTDPSTGLLNAREITRQIEAYRASGLTFSLIRFELRGSVSEQVMKRAAAKIEGQFRHRDRIARWSDKEFLVLFQGPREVAESRAGQVRQTLTGRYDLDTGVYVEITVHAHLTHQELVPA